MVQLFRLLCCSRCCRIGLSISTGELLIVELNLTYGVVLSVLAVLANVQINIDEG